MKIILEFENGKESYVSLIGRFDDGKEKVSVLVMETCPDGPRSDFSMSDKYTISIDGKPLNAYLYELDADDADEGSVDHTYMKQLVALQKNL